MFCFWFSYLFQWRDNMWPLNYNTSKAKPKAKVPSKKKKKKKSSPPLPRKRERRMTMAMMIFVVAMVLVTVPAVEAQTSCVSKIVPCFSFLVNTTTKPSTDCCSSIKEAVEKEFSCLCTLYNTPGLLSQFNITTDQALGLNRRCDISTDLSACSGTLISPVRFYKIKGLVCGGFCEILNLGRAILILLLDNVLFNLI